MLCLRETEMQNSEEVAFSIFENWSLLRGGFRKGWLNKICFTNSPRIAAALGWNVLHVPVVALARGAYQVCWARFHFSRFPSMNHLSFPLTSNPRWPKVVPSAGVLVKLELNRFLHDAVFNQIPICSWYHVWTSTEERCHARILLTPNDCLRLWIAFELHCLVVGLWAVILEAVLGNCSRIVVWQESKGTASAVEFNSLLVFLKILPL